MTMNSIKIILSLCVPVIMWGLPAVASSVSTENGDRSCIAMVDTRVVTASEFQNLLARLRSGGDMKMVFKTLNDNGKKQILTEFIEQKLLAIDARASHIDSQPEVQKAIQVATDKVLAKARIDAEIKRIDLSEERLLQYYHENSDRFRLPDRIKTRHIVTRTREDAQDALARLKKGESFQEIASEVNIDASRKKGGELGLVSRGIMVKPFEDALFSLAPGETSDIIKTSFGFHIIRAEKIIKGNLEPFEMVKGKIKEQIIAEHLSKLKKALWQKYPVQINEEVLYKATR